MKKRRIIYLAAALVLLAVLGYSVFQLLSIRGDYAAEQRAHDALLRFRPEETPETGGSAHGDPDDLTPVDTAPFRNEKIEALQAEYPNAIGWITVPGTDVDYPFTQAADNDYYLRRGLDGSYLYAGVPFLDYRCAPDFSDGNTILYGHNLRNGTMFGTLESFKDESFFQAHRWFTVYLKDRTIRAEILACVVFRAETTPFLYQIEPPEDYTDRLSQAARCCMDLSRVPRDARYITLSTCDYETRDGRTVLIGRILD